VRRGDYVSVPHQDPRRRREYLVEDWSNINAKEVQYGAGAATVFSSCIQPITARHAVVEATLLGTALNVGSIHSQCSTIGPRHPASRILPCSDRAVVARRACLGQRRRAAGQPAAQRPDPDFSLPSISGAKGGT
jgi:hypothetical protein